VNGKIILIGSSAAGLKDLRATPLNPVTAGTEVHVQLLEQAMTQEFLNRPDWAEGAELLFLIFTGVVLILILPFIGALWSAVLGLVFSAAAYGFSWYLFEKHHWLLDPVTPVLASLLIYVTVSLMHYLRTEKEKHQIRGAFSRYVSPALLEKISRNPGQLKLGGENRDMSILFSDIRNFTTRSEQQSAQELTHFMNRYLTPMTDLILNHNGTIDKYIGDCIMAFWNAPIDVPDHPRQACLAALHMLSHLKTWNAEMETEAVRAGHSFTPVAIGIGINSGHCCVGNMGSNQRFDYSVLGDEVNLASRLEGQSKVYGVTIVIGQNTYEQTREFAYLELDLIKVKGKTKPVRIYTLLGDEKMRQTELFGNVEAQHNKMLEAYRSQDWKTARKEVEALQALHAYDLDALYRFYAERIQEEEKKGSAAVS
jgi:adenylate cyclase